MTEKRIETPFRRMLFIQNARSVYLPIGRVGRSRVAVSVDSRYARPDFWYSVRKSLGSLIIVSRLCSLKLDVNTDFVTAANSMYIPPQAFPIFEKTRDNVMKN